MYQKAAVYVPIKTPITSAAVLQWPALSSGSVKVSSEHPLSFLLPMSLLILNLMLKDSRDPARLWKYTCHIIKRGYSRRKTQTITALCVRLFVFCRRGSLTRKINETWGNIQKLSDQAINDGLICVLGLGLGAKLKRIGKVHLTPGEISECLLRFYSTEKSDVVNYT